MLNALSIRDIVLIEKLDISLAGGMTVLSGETGAGKSILLDALGLALGARGAAGLVRTGAEKGVVTAAFSLSEAHGALALLDEHGIEVDGDLVIRRIQTSDGPSRAFINDQPVSVNLLKQLGVQLAEIHGQHDDRALVDVAGHRRLLDAFGGLSKQGTAVSNAWECWSSARQALEEHEVLISKAAVEKDYLEFVTNELRELAPQQGEEETLAARRQMMMYAEQFSETVGEALDALADDGTLDARLGGALRKLERRREQAAGLLDDACNTLDRLVSEISEAQRVLNQAKGNFVFDAKELDDTETRLFAMKAAARKHGVPADQLPALAEKFDTQLQAIADGGNRLEELREAAGDAEAVYMKLAEALSGERAKAAGRLDKAVVGELAPLRLEQARFRTDVDADSDHAGAHGIDKVIFQIAANPGTPLRPLAKVASGGELSRFMLALKAVLAASGSAPTLIFDEIDTGVGGAVADAVGQRLARMAASLQVLAVTHSPQVAARADQHLLISKITTVGGDDARMVTRVVALGGDSRREEIARMLSAAEVTDEARAQADRLLLQAS